MSLIGAAAIGAGASLLGNIFGKKSNDNANATNLKIAQMNNEWSEKMMQKQMDYNTAQWLRESAFSKQQAADANAFTEKMWNKTNEYNSAANQAARLREAGLNPALVMSGQNAGTASGASAAQAATPSGNSVGLPSPSSASVRPYQFDFSGIGSSLFNALSMDAQIQKSDSESRFINMQADYYGAKTMAEIGKLYAETDSHTAKTYYQRLMNKYGDGLMQQQYYNEIRKGQSWDVQIANSIKQGLLLDKDVAYYDARANGDLSEQLSRISLNYANGELSLQQTEKALQETFNAIEQRIGMKIDNDIKANLRDTTIERGKQARNYIDLGFDGIEGMRKFGVDAMNWINSRVDKYIVKPSKRAYKDTRRAFGIY